MTNRLVLSDTTTEFEDFSAEFNSALAKRDSWKGSLTIQTSQTLIELVSTIGAFDNAKLLRYFENSFPETSQSDGAIHAIAVMQGLRLTRKLPSGVPVTLTSDRDLTIAPYGQFNIGGQYFFNRETLVFTAGETKESVTLFQGKVNVVSLTGIGSDFQVFMSEADSFEVSDQDVVVVNNQVLIPKAYGGLWNYKNKPGYSDLTHPDGRLMIQFGSTVYGTVPQVNDQLLVVYVTTLGADGDALVVVNTSVVLNDSTAITGTALSNPTGGANQKDPLTYKNVSAGAAGAFSSAVTKNHYRAMVSTYPGIVDAITQAQREINPMNPQWMNVIRISALTTSPWTNQQKKAFCEYAQEVSMYSPHFLWQDPVPVYRDIEIDVYCHNTAVLSMVETKVHAAITALLAAQPGILQTNHFPSDLDAATRRACPGDVSHVDVVSPVGDMLVTAPPSPALDYEITVNGGTLTPLVYSYGVSVVNAAGEEGSPANWVFPQVTGSAPCGIVLNWQPADDVQKYKVWGRKAGHIGLLAELTHTNLTWADNGSVVPTAEQPKNTVAELPIRYNKIRSLKVTAYFSTRQQRFGS